MQTFFPEKPKQVARSLDLAQRLKSSKTDSERFFFTALIVVDFIIGKLMLLTHAGNNKSHLYHKFIRIESTIIASRVTAYIDGKYVTKQGVVARQKTTEQFNRLQRLSKIVSLLNPSVKSPEISVDVISEDRLKVEKVLLETPLGIGSISSGFRKDTNIPTLKMLLSASDTVWLEKLNAFNKINNAANIGRHQAEKPIENLLNFLDLDDILPAEDMPYDLYKYFLLLKLWPGMNFWIETQLKSILNLEDHVHNLLYNISALYHFARITDIDLSAVERPLLNVIQDDRKALNENISDLSKQFSGLAVNRMSSIVEARFLDADLVSNRNVFVAATIDGLRSLFAMLQDATKIPKGCNLKTIPNNDASKKEANALFILRNEIEKKLGEELQVLHQLQTLEELADMPLLRSVFVSNGDNTPLSSFMCKLAVLVKQLEEQTRHPHKKQ